jgi:hypothetical protein
MEPALLGPLDEATLYSRRSAQFNGPNSVGFMVLSDDGSRDTFRNFVLL